MSEMPYLPTGNGCDLCGRSAPLRRVTIAKGGKRKLARVAYVCDAHEGMAGAPVPVPRTQTAEGTSERRPQTEGLF